MVKKAVAKKATKKATVAKKARRIAEDTKAAVLSERPTPTQGDAISAPVLYDVVLVQSDQPTSYPQVYDPDGRWIGFFTDEATALDWIRKQPNRGQGFVMNHTPPPRKVRVERSPTDGPGVPAGTSLPTGGLVEIPSDPP